MSWSRVDDSVVDHPGVLEAGDAALGALIRLGGWSARHLTDGRIPVAAARLLIEPSTIDRMVSVGWLVAVRDGYQIATELIHLRPAAEVRADRAAAAQRQARARDRGREGQERDPAGRMVSRVSYGISHGVTDGVTHDVSHPVPDPTRPDPDPDPGTTYPAAVAAAAPAAPRAAGRRPESTTPTRRAPESTRRARRSDPLPISIAAYVAAIAAAAAKRWNATAPIAARLHPALGRLIRQHPTLDAPRILGAYLAAGYAWSTDPRGPSWLASAAGAEAMAAAIAWEARGRPPPTHGHRGRRGDPKDPGLVAGLGLGLESVT